MSVAFRDPATGSTETRRLESETDILLMFSKPGSTRFALHIENTLATGTFTPDQPDFYLARARHMADNPPYGDYADFDTVLTAPRKFMADGPTAARSSSDTYRMKTSQCIFRSLA